MPFVSLMGRTMTRYINVYGLPRYPHYKLGNADSSRQGSELRAYHHSHVMGTEMPLLYRLVVRPKVVRIEIR